MRQISDEEQATKLSKEKFLSTKHNFNSVNFQSSFQYQSSFVTLYEEEGHKVFPFGSKTVSDWKRKLKPGKFRIQIIFHEPLRTLFFILKLNLKGKH